MSEENYLESPHYQLQQRFHRLFTWMEDALGSCESLVEYAAMRVCEGGGACEPMLCLEQDLKAIQNAIEQVRDLQIEMDELEEEEES